MPSNVNEGFVMICGHFEENFARLKLKEVEKCAKGTDIMRVFASRSLDQPVT